MLWFLLLLSPVILCFSVLAIGLFFCLVAAGKQKDKTATTTLQQGQNLTDQGNAGTNPKKTWLSSTASIAGKTWTGFWSNIGKIVGIILGIAIVLLVVWLVYTIVVPWARSLPSLPMDSNQTQVIPLPSEEKRTYIFLKQGVPTELPQVKTEGHHWHIHLGDATDICEFRGEKTLSDGTVKEVGPWTFGGKPDQHIDLPECKKYWVTLKNNDESKIIWWED